MDLSQLTISEEDVLQHDGYNFALIMHKLVSSKSLAK